jgi:hypothetical protein
MGEARQIVEMAQQEERDVDAVSFLEQVPASKRQNRQSKMPS